MKLPSGTTLFGVTQDGQLCLTAQIDLRPETSRLEVVMDWAKLLEGK